MRTFTVGEMARLSGVTVRTLHHYDDIGLLPASGRTEAGYRTYGEGDVDRLRAILTYRELGLGLDEVAMAIDSDAGSLPALRSARVRVQERIGRLEAVKASLDAAIDAETRGDIMTPEEKLSVFGDFDPTEYEAEVEERWGDTEAYAESARRTSAYGKADWEAIQEEAAGIYARFLELANAGTPPESDEAARVVEEHRRHISTWFYECSPQIHAGLGAMYVADERFTKNIDEAGEGLAAYMSAAFAAAYRAPAT
jgi:MerR family transcriptional regulator, thiopeptide resistance regulator